MQRTAPKLGTPDRPLGWLGVNYWSRTGGPFMWRHYDGAVVGEELAVLKAHGITLTRSFLHWPDFHPEPERLDPRMLERYDDFLDRHLAAGMTTVPTFLVGHMSGQNWDPAWREGREVFADEWFTARQAWYVAECAKRWKDHPAVAGWLLSNEIPIYADWRSRGIGTLDHRDVTRWARTLTGALRATGARQPVSLGDGAWGLETTGADNGFRIRELAGLIDFHGPHVYRMEDDPVRQHLGAAFTCELLGIGGKPVVLEEFGVTSDYTSEENAAHYYRQTLHHTLLAGATGWIPWNNTDYDALADQEPYLHHPFEMHFGLTDHQGRPKRQLHEVADFAAVLERTGFPRLHRPDTALTLIVSSYLEKEYPFTQPEDAAAVLSVTRQAYVAAREADLPIGVAREADGLPADSALYLLPSAKQLTAPSWRELRAHAARGATVYASYFSGAHGTQRGPWWPGLDETFGVVKQLRYGLTHRIEDEELRMVFRQDFGDLRAGEELRFAVSGTAHSRAYLPVVPDGAEVVAEDAHGRPALLRHRTGRGQLVLCTYPLEHMAAETREVNPEPTWRLYAALAAEAGALPPVTVPDGRVVTGELAHEDGRRFVWFLSQHPGPLTVRPRVREGRLTGLDGEQVTEVALDAYGVLVAERVR
ncbi:cellulase family glycosylhydrolase [Streptomyces physcomitrii]|uniref:Cellulase family glycosylhydrolase n=1 Tax=Streptomyces physcomitrii TaxID=2724184 RepID=A0ABX1H1B6_9ACTN|nr:cellulase family glycosylhydrolase [Streptomyces physcomitrii]NKI42161.1 cellulase family glycosylhydrolase [Streptomyces physcomitrii]